jgi:hypothetical protein
VIEYPRRGSINMNPRETVVNFFSTTGSRKCSLMKQISLIKEGLFFCTNRGL